jgi:hypothetical protein
MIRLQRAGVIAALNLLVFAGLAAGAGPASAATCQPNAPAPTNQYPGTTVVATNFESGSLTGSGFKAPVTSGNGTAVVSSAQQRSGRCAAHLHVTTAASSVANFSAALPARSNDVYADGWFNVAKQGPANNNVPYFRFFNGSTRVIDVFRANSASGALWLRVTSPTGTYSYTSLRPSVALGSWHHLVMHVVPNGASTAVEVWFDDQLVYSSRQVATGFKALTAVQLGAEHRRQAGDSYIDDVVIKSSVTPAPGASKRLNDFTNDGKTDLIARDASGQLWLYPGTGTGTWSRRVDLGAGWNVMSAIVSAGDFNGDNNADVIARDRSGELWFYPGTGNGNWSKRQNMGGGWNVMSSIVAPGDFNGDGRPDLIARDTSGELWLYPNDGAGDWFKRVDLGPGWNIMSSIAAPGDFDADGKVDLVARDTNGQLWLYPGNGQNEWFTRVSLGAGWNTMSAITAPGDMNGDGRPDVIARDTTGELWLYPNNGAGDWLKRIDLGPGWNPMTAIL